jgi:CheY-like chemotaxis protein
MEAIGHLAGGIAHDFNNILTIINGRSELALFTVTAGDPLRRNIEEIKRASERAASLTQQLLAFGRRQILEFKVLDLNAILLDMNTMLRRVIGEDIELVTVPGEDLGKVKTDPSQVEQVILNLAVNARDAMPNGGRLILETANVDLDEEYARAHVAVTPGSYVRLSVSDTGVGMTSDLKDHIFEPFFTTKEKGKGTGLGLSTVYGIVKQSGGNIWVYSELGHGTVFKIYLPRVDEPGEPLEKSVRWEEAPRGRESILLVEDEGAVRELAAQFLRNQGYAVLEASQGDEAFLVFGKHKGAIDLLVTDVVMPGMSGRELAGQLRALRSKIKVLYMSGYTDDSIVRHGVLEEGVNFIQKPFSMVKFAQKVREVLGKGADPAG